MRILIVEDDAALADVLARGLRHEGFAVDVAVHGADALDMSGYNRYDSVVLDRDLPVVHGDDVCRELMSRSRAPRVLMLTAAGDLADRVEGLTIGADDYLGKPFAIAEVAARLRALSRRPEVLVQPILSWNGIVIDPSSRTVERNGDRIHLTRKEFGVLEQLMRGAGAVVSSEELLERVWDQNADPFTNATRITMVTLRKKLGDPPVIQTVTGAGYRLV
jgi:DNA-binding response OmpR family regulator